MNTAYVEFTIHAPYRLNQVNYEMQFFDILFCGT